jgi:hypothetical protein
MTAIDDLQTALMQLLRSIGKYKIEEKKESIHIVRERAFLGIHPKKSYLGVNVVLNHSNAVPVASKIEQVSANRFHHFYKITDKRDLNKAFALLLKEAYDLGGPKK